MPNSYSSLILLGGLLALIPAVLGIVTNTARYQLYQSQNQVNRSVTQNISLVIQSFTQTTNLYFSFFAIISSLIGLIGGIGMVVSSIKSNKAANPSKWYQLAIIFSLVSLASGLSDLIGLVFGLTGGIVGLARDPRIKPKQ